MKIREKGQSLAEFAILLPAFLMLLAVIVSLLLQAPLPPWMDERLCLLLREPGGEDLQTLLGRSREDSMLPPYPAGEEVRETSTWSEEGRIPLLLFRKRYPGRTLEAEVTLRSAAVRDRAGWPFLDGFLPPPPDVTGKMRLTTARSLEEKQVRGEVGRIFLGGFLSGANTGKLLSKLGLDPLHVNLDALPGPRK